MHTSKAPRKARLMEATGKTHRRLASRVQLTTGCAAVTDFRAEVGELEESSKEEYMSFKRKVVDSRVLFLVSSLERSILFRCDAL